MIYAKSPCPILSNLRRPIRKIGADISSVMDRICSCHERGGRRAGMGRGGTVGGHYKTDKILKWNRGKCKCLDMLKKNAS